LFGRSVGLKRNLNGYLRNQLIKFLEPQNGTFYNKKGTVFPGLMAVQVKEMIREFEYSGILIDSNDENSDSSDSNVVKPDVLDNLLNQ